jgi:ankyrin repeat protein
MRKLGIAVTVTGLFTVTTFFFLCSEVFADQCEVLMEAVRWNNLKRVQDLLDKGTDVNSKDREGRTALMTALEPVIDLQADTLSFGKGKRTVCRGNAEVKYGSLVLLGEEGSRRTEIVRLLLEKGADVNGKDRDGRNALMLAIGPLIEVKGDSVTVFNDAPGVVTPKIKDGTVQVTRDPAREVEKLLKAHGAKE